MSSKLSSLLKPVITHRSSSRAFGVAIVSSEDVLTLLRESNTAWNSAAGLSLSDVSRVIDTGVNAAYVSGQIRLWLDVAPRRSHTWRDNDIACRGWTGKAMLTSAMPSLQGVKLLIGQHALMA